MKLKARFFILFVVFSFSAFANFNVKIYYEKFEKGYHVYVDNKEYCPVSVKIEFDLNNLRSKNENTEVFIIPANEEKFLLTSLEIINSKKSHKFKYNTITNIGNHFLNEVPNDFDYYLPYEKNKEYSVHQGYMSNSTHIDINALDFSMPVGTGIRAVRDGVVIKVVQSNEINCMKKDCVKYNNLLIVYHSDGTFAEYVHFKKNGSKVQVGDRVKQNELIALSGNVGRSSGPHLHLEIFLQHLDKRITLKTKFLTDEGNTSEILKEKRAYKRNY